MPSSPTLNQIEGAISIFQALLAVLSYLIAVGAWRSLVAHLNGVEGVVGSNPIAPTIYIRQENDPRIKSVLN